MHVQLRSEVLNDNEMLYAKYDAHGTYRVQNQLGMNIDKVLVLKPCTKI